MREKLLAGLLAVSMTACWTIHYPENPRISQARPLPEMGTALAGTGNSPEILMILAFSGGGTRAAALSYGVLEVLDRTEIEIDGEARTLLDEVDLISSVSGGSFTAASFGLHGRGIFEDFDEQFLRRNVTLGLLRRLLMPYTWLRLASPRFNRSDMAAEYYDKILFKGAGIGDVSEPGGPLIEINATDLIGGNGFTFSESQFLPLCSDVSDFPISRAVAASSAVPVLMAPVTVRNYAGTCDFEPPNWLTAAYEERDTTQRSFHSARRLFSYLETSRNFIHLIDGGISDNLGIRGPVEMTSLQGGISEVLGETNSDRERHVVFIIVNAQTTPDQSFGLVDIAPDIAQILDWVTSIQISNYNLETIELLRRSIERWDLEIRLEQSRQGGSGDTGVNFYAIEVSFEAHDDPEERRYLSGLPTSFNLSDSTITRLRQAANSVLTTSPDYQRLLKNLSDPQTHDVTEESESE